MKRKLKCTGCKQTWDTFDRFGYPDSLLQCMAIAAHIDYMHGQNLQRQITNYAVDAIMGQVKQ